VTPPSPNDGLIFEQMRRVAAVPAFGAAIAGLRRDEQTLATASRVATERYLRTRDFTVLHLVTSAHALRVLLPLLDPDDLPAALGHYWLAFAAAHAASGAGDGRRAALPRVAVQPWPVIVARAIASDDEHLIKLVDSCLEHDRAYGGAVWREAASRAVAV
jgi:hypothetical protein